MLSNRGILYLALSVIASVFTAVVVAQVQPCAHEYTGSSCEAFMPPGPVECSAIVLQSGYCPQTIRASTGLMNQDPPFEGPTCHIIYRSLDPVTGLCVQSGEYNGHGFCRTASGASCPSSGPPL